MHLILTTTSGGRVTIDLPALLRDLDDEARQHQVLLDLVAADPRHHGRPVREVGWRDHTSGSIGRLRMRRHLGSIVPRRPA